MDNLDKLLEAIEHPERFSDSELCELLSDPETNRLYLLMSASRAEEFLHDSFDSSEVDRQWNLFKTKRHRKAFFSRIYSRKTAAVAAVLIASCSIIVVGVSLGSRLSGHADRQEADQTAVTVSQPKEVWKTHQQVNDTVIVFEDEKLDRILAEIAPYYNVRVDLKYPSSKGIRLFLKDDVITDY